MVTKLTKLERQNGIVAKCNVLVCEDGDNFQSVKSYELVLWKQETFGRSWKGSAGKVFGTKKMKLEEADRLARFFQDARSKLADTKDKPEFVYGFFLELDEVAKLWFRIK